MPASCASVALSALSLPQSRSERDPARIAALLQDARDAAQFLSDFVVQGARSLGTRPRGWQADALCASGERTEQGNFAVALKPQHAGKQVEVPRVEEDDPDSGCCTRAPPAPPVRPK